MIVVVINYTIDFFKLLVELSVTFVLEVIRAETKRVRSLNYLVLFYYFSNYVGY